MGRILNASLLSLPIALVSLTANAEPCLIEGKATTENIKIELVGEEAFHLTIKNLPVSLVPGDADQGTLEVYSPLRFQTSHPIDRMGIRLAKKRRLYGGRLVLAKGLAPSLAPQGSKSQDGTVGVQFPFLDLQVDGLRLPCSDLKVGDATSNPDEVGSPILPRSSVQYIHTKQPITLYRTRQEVDPLVVRVGQPIQIINQRRQWLHLRSRWPDGSRLQGWAQKDGLTILRGEPEGYGSFMGSLIGRSCGRLHPPTRVRLRLHKDAPITNGPSGTTWAHVAKAITVYATPRDDDWIQIVSIKGFPIDPCEEHKNIWVQSKHTSSPL